MQQARKYDVCWENVRRRLRTKIEFVATTMTRVKIPASSVFGSGELRAVERTDPAQVSPWLALRSSQLMTVAHFRPATSSHHPEDTTTRENKAGTVSRRRVDSRVDWVSWFCWLRNSGLKTNPSSTSSDVAHPTRTAMKHVRTLVRRVWGVRMLGLLPVGVGVR